MMSTNVTIFILSLNNVSAQINRYLSIFIFVFGIVGNILNCLVLSERKLRTNPCSFLFLVSSIASFISLLSGLTTRMLSGWAMDLTNTVSWLCKVRAFVLFVSRTVVSWLLASASIDRWLSSSANHLYRRKSSLKNAYRYIIIIILFSMLLYVQILYCYESNQINTPLKCYGKTDMCRLTNDLSYAVITIMIPIIVMVIFGLMTIANVRQSCRRVFPTTTVVQRHKNVQNQRSRWKKIDCYLLLMLLVQIVLHTFLTFPQATQKIYSTLTSQQTRSSVQESVENLIFNCLLLLTYFSSGIPFYIHTMCGGKLFRETLVNVLKRLWTRNT